MSGVTFDKAKFSAGLRDNVVNKLGKIESSVKSNTKQHEGYIETDLVILNHGPITRTTSELVPPLQTTPAGGHLALIELISTRPYSGT
ncbi:hypothetical protein AVEN_88957-1 [Araneus ventricosus]|uniref:Uncharacterized protein n=1 Tax=Araneus ventricosus TaxID=182803 RepID=A0A4Y2DLA7_ARAVE|nr:hypothetical protein AVEN_88957-1 [Araneus ventricosus]